VFKDSELRMLVESGELGFPDPKPLPGLTENLPYYVLGEDAFPLRTWMMKPYSRMGLGYDERISTTGCPVPEGWWRMLSEYWPTDFNICFMQQLIRKQKT